MRASLLTIGVLAGLTAGCSTNPIRPSARVVVPVSRPAPSENANAGRTIVKVPPGHYPPPGQCRVWYQGRPPGKQPRATRCDDLVGTVPHGAIVLYNAKAWDTRVDWRGRAKKNPGSVPEVVLLIMASVDKG